MKNIILLAWITTLVGFTATTAEAQTLSNTTFSRTHTTKNKTLTRAQLLQGFTSVRLSTQQCMERQLKQSNTFPVESVRIVLTIARTGKVRRIEINRALRRTAFGKCLKAHSKRWRFDTFAGSPIKASKSYRLVAPTQDEDFAY